MKKLDEREIARAEGEEEDEVTGRTLDEATEMIKKLHKDVLDAQKRVGDVTRERDLFSKMLARGEGLRWSVSASSGHPGVHGVQHGHGPLDEDTDTPSNQQLATLQAELDVFKEKAHGDLEEARKEIRKKMEEAAKADVERARAEAKAGLLEGKCLTSSHTLLHPRTKRIRCTDDPTLPQLPNNRTSQGAYRSESTAKDRVCGA